MLGMLWTPAGSAGDDFFPKLAFAGREIDSSDLDRDRNGAQKHTLAVAGKSHDAFVRDPWIMFNFWALRPQIG